MNFLQKWTPSFINYGGLLGIVALSVLMSPDSFKTYGQIGMFLLAGILIISPLAAVFPRVPLFSYLKGLRKPFGIIAGCFMLAHPLGYFIHYSGFMTPLGMLTMEGFWGLKSGLMWGFLSALIAFALLITSNNFSIKILQNNWKYLHKLTHLLFLFVVIHVLFITGGKTPMILLSVYVVLHVLSYFKVKF